MFSFSFFLFAVYGFFVVVVFFNLLPFPLLWLWLKVVFHHPQKSNKTEINGINIKNNYIITNIIRLKNLPFKMGENKLRGKKGKNVAHEAENNCAFNWFERIS